MYKKMFKHTQSLKADIREVRKLSVQHLFLTIAMPIAFQLVFSSTAVLSTARSSAADLHNDTEDQKHILYQTF